MTTARSSTSRLTAPLAVAITLGLGLTALTLGTAYADVPFGPSSAAATPNFADRIAGGDLNGDGRMDVVTGGNDQPAKVLLTTTTGALGSPVTVAGTSTRAVRLADLDRDGRLDLVSTSESNHGVQVAKGKGDGTFGTPVLTALSNTSYPHALAVGDVDGDGDADVVSANTGTHDVAVYKNTGAGALAPAVVGNVNATVYPWDAQLADLDGDADLDLVYADVNSSAASGAPVLLNNGAGTFTAAAPVAAPVKSVAVVVTDLTGDGRPDAAVLGRTGEVVVSRGTGGGAFAPLSTATSGSYSEGMTGGDIDTDGDIDLVVGAEGRVVVLLNDGAGTFAPSPLAGSGLTVGTSDDRLGEPAIGDVDLDGNPDLVVTEPADKFVGSSYVGTPRVLLWRTTAPTATYSPTAALDTGSVPLGSAGPAAPIVVRGNGVAGVRVRSIQVTGPAAADFTVGTACTTTYLKATQTCSLPVTFRPSALGLRSATLTVRDNASSTPRTFTLTGTGQPRPVVTTAPTIRSFAATPAAFKVGRGSVLRVGLDAAGRGSVLVEAVTKGRKKGDTCAKAKPGAKGKSCQRIVRVGALPEVALAAGSSTVMLPGAVGGRTLKPGKYRLTLSVRAVDGTAVNTRTITVKVKAKKKR